MHIKKNEVDSKIRAWEPEISRYYFQGGKAQVNANKLPLVCHDKLQDFDERSDSLKRVLVGAKGTGKSTALARKAVQLVDNGFTVIPDYHPYVVVMEAVFVERKDNYSQYENHHVWRHIWKLAICAVFVGFENYTKLKSASLGKILDCDEGKPETEFFDSLGEQIVASKDNRLDFLAPILGLILNRNYDLEICQRLFTRHLRPKLPAAKAEPYVILIDQIDEALGAYRDRTHTSLDGQTIWEAAQTGIIDAVADVGNLAGGRFQVFVAIRSEAYRRYQYVGARTQGQVQSFCLGLRYSDTDLNDIFDLNVRLTDKKRLADQAADNATEKFFGTTKFTHPYVAGVQEDPFTWLARHTFGSPRELVVHGAHLVDLPPLDRCNREMVAKIVNVTGTEHFNDYISELVPEWKPEIAQIYKSITHNVLSQEEVQVIQEGAIETLDFEPIAYLYSAGLIGIPADDSQDKTRCVQSFLTIDSMTGVPHLPDASLYIIHPCMYPTICETLPKDKRANFHSHIFIAGNGLSCPKSIDPPKVYLLFDRTNSKVEVSILDSRSWKPDEDLIHSCIRENLTVSPTRNTGPILFLSLLLGMYEQKTNYPSVQSISEALEYLVLNGFAPDYMGKKENRNTSAEYCMQQLMYGENRTAAAQELKKSAESCDFYLHTQSAMERTSIYHIDGVGWTEIRRRGM